MDVDHTDVDAWTLSPLAKILITCLFAGISIIGVVGNFLVITLVLALPSMRTSFNLCLASLALADLMALTFQPIVTLRDLHNCDHSILGRSLCVIISSIERGSSVCGDLTFLLIGVERYTMLCHPLRTIGMWTRPKVCFVLLLIWIITVTVSIPFGYAARYEEIHANNFSDGVHDIGYHKPWIAPVQQSILGSNSTIKGTYCYIAFDIPWVMWYQTALICVSVFVPVPILATLCGKMILALRNRVSKNHCEGLGTRARRKSRSRIILMLVLVVIIFINNQLQRHNHLL
ncbi:mu-type opioid receptor-like [Liolophura sinensis]|uniref:mu-type opioid receptor-like n=1 Tax=Liolophura sinensis TaxID=3198878 RepID=UPI0031588F22